MYLPAMILSPASSLSNDEIGMPDGVGDLHDVSLMFTMEQIKSTTELPLVNASTRSGGHEGPGRATLTRHVMNGGPWRGPE
jgi:hypothetical protein